MEARQISGKYKKKVKHGGQCVVLSTPSQVGDTRNSLVTLKSLLSSSFVLVVTSFVLGISTRKPNLALKVTQC